MSSDRVYREQPLQQAAIGWLRDHWCYEELHSDGAAVGDRVDSVGRIEGRLFLIEVKPDLHLGLIAHQRNVPGSIESKIAGALRGLYGCAADRLSRVASSIWDRSAPPIFAILAGRYADGASERLSEMMALRSAEWLFDFRIWHWTGSAVIELGRGVTVPTPEADAYSAVQIDALVGRSKRRRSRSLAELREVAAERGFGPLFDRAIQGARDLAFRIGPRSCSSVMLQRPKAGASGWVSLIGLYPADSCADRGLAVGCWREAIGAELAGLPGSPAPNKIGFLNTVRYIRSQDEIDRLLKMFSQAGGHLPTIRPGPQ